MSRSEAREFLGLPAEGFVVLMTGGAWGLGDIAPGVEALLKMEPAVHVVAVCGKNATLEAELRTVAAGSGGRLVVYGYVSTMPELMAASNVVVTNGAGVTVLEALRTPRPCRGLRTSGGPWDGFDDRDGTAQLGRRGTRCPRPRRANPAVSDTDPDLLRTMELAGEAWVEGRDLQRSIGEIQALYALRHGALNMTADNVAAQG